MDWSELECLLALDGASFMMTSGVLVEFVARRTAITLQRPQGISYALVLRSMGGGTPWLRFDNAHAVVERRRGIHPRRAAHDHWHRTASDKGRAYHFKTAAQLLDDFWHEVRRVLDERGIAHDL